MKILVLNSGSSSLKYQVIDTETGEMLVKGYYERIGQVGAFLTHKVNGERNMALLEKLIGIPKEKRKIKFITAIALSDGNTTICKEGIIEGYVAKEPRGNNGFGFDEIFELENGKTLAELTQDEKNEISARKIALEQITKEINNL